MDFVEHFLTSISASLFVLTAAVSWTGTCPAIIFSSTQFKRTNNGKGEVRLSLSTLIARLFLTRIGRPPIASVFNHIPEPMIQAFISFMCLFASS